MIGDVEYGGAEYGGLQAPSSALGGGRASLVRLVIGQSMRVAFVGLIVGTGLALGVSKLFE